MKKKEQKRLAKKILEEYGEHPDWYTEADVSYASRLLNQIRQNKIVKKLMKQMRQLNKSQETQEGSENTY
jgi:hypothetical protein